MVPILPLIDLLILASTGSLLVGFVLKSVALTTHYRPTVMGFTSMDFVVIAGILLFFAIALAARTWVKLNEPRLISAARRTLVSRHALDLEDEAGEGELRAEARGVRIAK